MKEVLAAASPADPTTLTVKLALARVVVKDAAQCTAELTKRYLAVDAS